MAFWKSGKAMRCLWIGCIIMGLGYALFLLDERDALPFVIGQIVLGLIGLARESVVANRTTES